jgi:hypothetical protein
MLSLMGRMGRSWGRMAVTQGRMGKSWGWMAATGARMQVEAADVRGMEEMGWSRCVTACCERQWIEVMRRLLVGAASYMVEVLPEAAELGSGTNPTFLEVGN